MARINSIQPSKAIGCSPSEIVQLNRGTNPTTNRHRSSIASQGYTDNCGSGCGQKNTCGNIRSPCSSKDDAPNGPVYPENSDPPCYRKYYLYIKKARKKPIWIGNNGKAKREDRELKDNEKRREIR